LSTRTAEKFKVADEVWIATALLHQEHPSQPDFSTKEILNRVEQENVTGSVRPGVYVHIVQHCVANRPPDSGSYRILFETTEGRRRLFRKGDFCHPARLGKKSTPASEDIPEQYRELLAWYREWSEQSGTEVIENDPLLALRGSGKHIWADEHADEYVNRLRDGWE